MTKNEANIGEKQSEWLVSDKQMLEPFVHQVSGRAHMLTLNSDTLCKSLSKREWSFYNRLPASLRLFTPRLKGILFVHLVKRNCSSHGFIASDLLVPVNQLSNGESSYSHDAAQNAELNENKLYPASPLRDLNMEDKSCWKNTFEQTLFKGLKRVEYNSTDGFTGHAWTVDKDQEAATEALGKNPWALRQHQREINRTLKGDSLRKEVDMLELCTEIGVKSHENSIGNEPHTKAYLLLDDVTHSYKFPSILDIKIGTQLDRFDCSQAKKDKHFNLVKKSSTGSLGLRLAGMQVFQVDKKEYLCRDKYYGRGLSTKGFIDALAQFLHNGERSVTEVIPPIVNRIKELRTELEHHDTYRFHASSVLITYESASDADLNFSSIPFSNKEISNQPKTSQETVGICFNAKEDASLKSNGNRHPNSRLCSVYMIDFAHSTYQGFLEDKIIHEGPDKDCLNALDNLIAVLNDILKNSRGPS